MKNVLFFLSLLVLFLPSYAQKLDRVKDYLTRNKLAEANKEIDAFLAIDKNKSNSEAYYVKGKILHAISNDAALKGTIDDPKAGALSFFNKYLEMEAATIPDSTKRNIAMVMDNNQPVYDLYREYSGQAAKDYNDNKFEEAALGFGKCLEVFDFLRKYRLVSATFDTTTTLYAGIAAEKAKKRDLAAKYYSRIAENKLKSEGFIEIYKWMADYYRQKDDVSSSGKFVQYGREVYPGDPFWDEFDLDMLREKDTTKKELFKKYEQVIDGNPTNYVYPYNYAVELFQTGYNPDAEKRPSDYKEIVDKTIKYLNKCIELNPDYPNAYMLLGQIQYNAGVDINTQMKAIKIPPGEKLKPEEMKKREELKKQKEELRGQTNAKFDLALPYLEKVEKLLDTKGKLKMEEKLLLKDCLDLMVIIYETKGNKEKTSEYTDKYNDVDKKHSGK